MEEYLHKHKSIKIFRPVSRYKEICLIFGEKRVFCFINSNLKGFYDFASPLIPRAYTEGVVHDSLSIASWMGYSKIFLIGLDNTYPRKLYSDANNSILNCTYYASEDTGFLEDTTLRYGTMADRVLSISFLFYSANLLAKNGNIINLDPYSLTDAFEKVKITNNNYSNIW